MKRIKIRIEKQSEAAPLVYNSLDDLLAILKEERRKSLYRRSPKRILISIAVTLIVYVAVTCLLTLLFHHDFLSGGIGGAFAGLFGGMRAATGTQRQAALALTNFDDVRAVPRLIELLDYNDKDISANVLTLLDRLLPRLQASDAALFTPDQHAVISRLLAGKINLYKASMPDNQRWRMQVGLRVKMLHALQQIGGAGSLPVVEALIAGKHGAIDNPDLQQAARDCLPFLQERAAHQQRTQHLLRPADPNAGTDSLLRAASSNSAVPTDELLRTMEAASGNTPTVSAPALSQTQLTLPLEPEAQPVLLNC